jgi:hypothetical protein
MCKYERFSVSLALCLFVLGIYAPIVHAQSPIKTIDYPQGGKIVFGLVDGATTAAAAMGKVLRSMHDNCGERPQVGKIFKASGTHSVAVFVTVVNHPQGNVQAVGLLIAVPSGPNQIEAALVSDDAARSGSTVNPMLNRLFSEWHPGGAATTASASSGASSASASTPSAGGEGAVPPLRRVTLPDNTASVSLPDGWKLGPDSGGGTIWVIGPQGEQIALDLAWLGQDPDDPSYRKRVKMHLPTPKRCVVYPHNVDLAKSFPDIFQRLRATTDPGPIPLEIDHAEQAPASPGVRCANVTGTRGPRRKRHAGAELDAVHNRP